MQSGDIDGIHHQFKSIIRITRMLRRVNTANYSIVKVPPTEINSDT